MGAHSGPTKETRQSVQIQGVFTTHHPEPMSWPHSAGGTENKPRVNMGGDLPATPLNPGNVTAHPSSPVSDGHRASQAEHPSRECRQCPCRAPRPTPKGAAGEESLLRRRTLNAPGPAPGHGDPGSEAAPPQPLPLRPLPARRALTNLPVGHADQPLVHQLVRLGVSGLSLHDVALGLLVGQGDGRDLGRKGFQASITTAGNKIPAPTPKTPAFHTRRYDSPYDLPLPPLYE